MNWYWYVLWIRNVQNSAGNEVIWLIFTCSYWKWSASEITDNLCYYPPPIGFWRSGKIYRVTSAGRPPPQIMATPQGVPPGHDLETNPTCPQPGFTLPRRQFVTLNRLSCVQARCTESLHRWGVIASPHHLLAPAERATIPQGTLLKSAHSLHSLEDCDVYTNRVPMQWNGCRDCRWNCESVPNEQQSRPSLCCTSQHSNFWLFVVASFVSVLMRAISLGCKSIGSHYCSKGPMSNIAQLISPRFVHLLSPPLSSLWHPTCFVRRRPNIIAIWSSQLVRWFLSWLPTALVGPNIHSHWRYLL